MLVGTRRSLLSAGGSTSPLANIPDLVLLLDSRRGVFQDSTLLAPAAALNDPVGGWRDQSGLGNTCVQATAGNRMKYRPGGLRGHPAVYGFIDSANAHWLTIPVGVSVDKQAVTVIVIGRAQGLNNSAKGLVELGGANPVLFGNMSSNRDLWFLNQASPISTTLAPRADALFLGWNASAGGTTVYSAGETAAMAAAASAVVTGSRLGHYTGGGASQGFVGEFYEVGIWNRSLSASEIAQIKAYVASEYGGGYNQDRQIVCDGDSLTIGSSTEVSNPYPWQMAVPLGPLWKIHNLGVGGRTVNTCASVAAARVDPIFSGGLAKNVCVIFAGTNDNLAGTAVATIESDYQTYCAARQSAGWKVVSVTMLPRTIQGSWIEQTRTDFNIWLRANWATFSDALADVAADSRIGDVGDNNDATYYSTDHIHPNDTGYGVVAGIIRSAVESV